MWERKKDYTGPSSRHTEQYNKPSKEYKINNNSNIMTIIIWLIIWCLFCGGAPWCELPWQVYEQFFSFFIHFKSVMLIYFCQKLSIKKNSLNFGRVHQMTFYSLFFFFFFFTFFLFLKQSGKYLSRSLYKYSKYTGLHKTGWYKNLQDFWHGWWLVHHCFVVLHWEKVGKKLKIIITMPLLPFYVNKWPKRWL